MQRRRHQTLSERIASAGLRVHCALIFLFLVAPILAIVPLSFNSGSFFSYPMDGFSLRWYEQAFGSHDWQLAFANSIGIGAVATLIATCLGTLAALGLSRSVFPFRAVVMPLLISPMIIPIVVVAAGFYLDLLAARARQFVSGRGARACGAWHAIRRDHGDRVAAVVRPEPAARRRPVSARDRGRRSAASRCR